MELGSHDCREARIYWRLHLLWAVDGRIPNSTMLHPTLQLVFLAMQYSLLRSFPGTICHTELLPILFQFFPHPIRSHGYEMITRELRSLTVLLTLMHIH